MDMKGAITSSEGKEMKVRTKLPEEIKRFTYAKNHHYIELEDKYGNVHKLIPTSLVKYKCDKCQAEFFIAHQYGKIRCPICMEELDAGVWGNMQLSFVPEKESDFQPPKVVKGPDEITEEIEKSEEIIEEAEKKIEDLDK